MAKATTNLAWECWHDADAEAWVDAHDLTDYFYRAAAARRIVERTRVPLVGVCVP